MDIQLYDACHIDLVALIMKPNACVYEPLRDSKPLLVQLAGHNQAL